ncbi:MAG TPA: hypothetical protein ENL05_01460, partial [Candidatus Moranbacteria bacterium]|nr:hypothetical protein [Candidatus Moranbacteria bacterium]
MLLNEKIKFFLAHIKAHINKKVFSRNLFVIILGVLFFLLRYQFPWIVFFILTPFFYFAQKNRNFFSFVLWGILTGIFFVSWEYSFLLNISTYTYLGAIIFYGCFFFFIPFFILLFISNLINKHQWFFYPSSATISFWLYNFTFLHYPLLSPLDGLTHYPFFLQLMN